MEPSSGDDLKKVTDIILHLKNHIWNKYTSLIRIISCAL